MKLYIVLFCLFTIISNNVLCQYIPVDPTTNKTVYAEVVDVANKKDVLYKNAQTWITKSFGDYKAVIQFEDKAEGKLIFKAFSKLEFLVSDKLNYTIVIDCKDNKYRCVISDIYQGVSRFPTDRFPVERLNELIEKGTKELQQLEKEISVAKKKSQVKDLEDKIDRRRRTLDEYKDDAAFTNTTMKSLLSSLKAAMATNDEF